MKAAQYATYGGPEVLHLSEIAKPSLKEGQILVEVNAASVNPFDYKLRRGTMKDTIPLTLPVTIGSDFSGVVIDANGSEYASGDEVYGQAIILSGASGAMAELTSVNLKSITKKPNNVDFVQASALPLVGVSAIQALKDHLQLEKGQKILIHGGAGGIGSVAIQLAKYIGAYVATTVSGEDTEFAKSLGADEVIDYKTQKFEDMLKDYDAVFDTVGGENPNKSLAVLKNGGKLVSMVGPIDENLAKEKNITALVQNSKTNTESLRRLKELVEEHVIKPKVDKVFSLEQVSDAYSFAETGHPNGKVVVKIKE